MYISCGKARNNALYQMRCGATGVVDLHCAALGTKSKYVTIQMKLEMAEDNVK